MPTHGYANFNELIGRAARERAGQRNWPKRYPRCRGWREVYPEQVEAALLAVPGVLDVQACSMPDPVLGELIRVDVLTPGHRTVAARKRFKEELQAYCREVLEPWQRPARYYFHG